MGAERTPSVDADGGDRVVEQALEMGGVDVDDLAVGAEVAVAADERAASTVNLHRAEGVVAADQREVLVDVAGCDAELGTMIIAPGEEAERAAADHVREARAAEPAVRPLAEADVVKRQPAAEAADVYLAPEFGAAVDT